MSEERKTVDDIVAEMWGIADIVERNLAQQPGAKTVAQTRRIERKLRAEELRVLAKRIGEAIKQERIQRDKVSFRCGDCARFGTDCKAGNVDGNEDCVACERFVKRSREPVTNCNGLGNVAKMRKALFAVYDWILKAGLVHGYVDTPQKRRQLYDMMTKALSAKPRNCDVGKPWKQAERFSRFCESNRVFYNDMFGHDDEGRLDGWDCHENCPAGKVVDKHSCMADHCELAWAQMPYDEKGDKA